MKKKIVTILVIIALVLAVGIAAALGWVWYRDNHIFVDGTAYPLNAESLDMRDKDLTVPAYDSIQKQLPNCYILWNVPLQGQKVQSDSERLTITALSQEDVAAIAGFLPNLRTLDATGCRDYLYLKLLEENRPELEIRYTVSLGSKEADPKATELVLEPADYDFATLMENLQWLESLTSVKLRMPEITTEQVDELRAAYPALTITCTAEILGAEYDTETTELDLSSLTAEGVDEVAQKLVLLPGLTHVNLMTAEGTSQLEKAHVKTLMDAAPNVVFDYAFDFFGTTVSTADQEVIVKNTKIGDENEAEVRLTLDLLTNCSRFVLDNCKLSDEVMEKIREDYRGRTKVVWRVWFGEGSSLTDAQVIRAVYNLVDDNCHDLYYCEDARYVDFGHNEWLDACDFVAGMKSLEYVIISGAPIKSLEPFRNCKNLKMLEVAFCEYLTDASPLAECTSLEMLNISNTHIVDLSPLDNLPLTNLVARYWTESGQNSRVSVEEQERFMAANPDCKSYFSDKKNPYGEGWRYEEVGTGYLPTYSLIRRVFRYDQDPNIPNHVGWYLKNEEQEPTE